MAFYAESPDSKIRRGQASNEEEGIIGLSASTETAFISRRSNDEFATGQGVRGPSGVGGGACCGQRPNESASKSRACGFAFSFLAGMFVSWVPLYLKNEERESHKVPYARCGQSRTSPGTLRDSGSMV